MASVDFQKTTRERRGGGYDETQRHGGTIKT